MLCESGDLKGYLLRYINVLKAGLECLQAHAFGVGFFLA